MILDTTALIDLAASRKNNHRQSAEAALLARVQAGERLFTTRINEAELRTGIYRARDAELERTRVERILAPLQILEFDRESAEQFAFIKAAALSRGRPIGDADLMIAAIALVNRQSLLTRNPSDFVAIPGLIIESY